MLTTILKIGSLVGLGAVVISCDSLSRLLGTTSTAEADTSSASDRVAISDCPHIRSSLINREIRDPVREFSIFRRLNLLTKTEANLSQTNIGNYSPLQSALGNDLNLLDGLRIYIGEDARINSQDDIDNLVSAYSYLTKLAGMQVNPLDHALLTPQNPDLRPRELIDAWNSNNIKVVFRSYELYKLRNRETYFRTIITGSNIHSNSQLTDCYNIDRNGDNYDDQVNHLHIITGWDQP